VKLGTARQAYYDLSATLSALIRQLCFAGIGVVWILRTGSEGIVIPFDSWLIVPLLLFSISLLLDILHYLLGSIMWSRFARRLELEDPSLKDEDEIGGAPDHINLPANICFYGKTGLCFFGLLILSAYLYQKI